MSPISTQKRQVRGRAARRWSWLAMVLALFAVSGHADDDPPGAVGRLSDAAGQVYIATEDRSSEWAPIAVNYPLIPGDNVWVSEDGRAEIEFATGFLRLAGNTNIHLSQLDDAALTASIASGRMIVRLRSQGGGQRVRIDTPNAQVSIDRPGVYRIDVADKVTTVTVKTGEAELLLADLTQPVAAGQTISVEGAGEHPLLSVRDGYSSDGFDAWSAARDSLDERSRWAGHVSPEMIGAGDLTDYGSWTASPEYGAVWYPANVALDWAPYRYGQWYWGGPWGWTWVDDAPWGFAPSHYGRWVHIAGRWGWCPGRYVARPAYAPALVGWYGGSQWGASLGLSSPAYGWVPLAWGERYRPSFGCTRRCVENLNRPYAVNLAERVDAPPTRYINASVPGAVTAVPRMAFGGERPSPKPHAVRAVRVSTAALASASILSMPPDLASAASNGRETRASSITGLNRKPLNVTKPVAERPTSAPSRLPSALVTPPSVRPVVKPMLTDAQPAPSPAGPERPLSVGSLGLSRASAENGLAPPVAAEPAGGATAQRFAPTLRPVVPVTPNHGGTIVGAPPARPPTAGIGATGTQGLGTIGAAEPPVARSMRDAPNVGTRDVGSYTRSDSRRHTYTQPRMLSAPVIGTRPIPALAPSPVVPQIAPAVPQIAPVIPRLEPVVPRIQPAIPQLAPVNPGLSQRAIPPMARPAPVTQVAPSLPQMHTPLPQQAPIQAPGIGSAGLTGMGNALLR